VTASGVLPVNLSLAIGEFAKAGWLAYPPLSEIAFLPVSASTITFGPANIRLARCYPE
jgi:heme/copper-type cytochrome/quinol oxidase subunit 1